MKTNYHTHTARCMHANGSDEDFVLSAIKGGFQLLGFSDHTPWKYRTDYVADMRMLPNELPEYVDSISSLRDKYKDQIDIKIGLECEYFPDYMPWLKEQIKKYKLDYVLFGNHHYHTDEKFPYFGHHTDSRDMLDLYEESAIEGMESGVFCCLGASRPLHEVLSALRPPLYTHQPAHLPCSRQTQYSTGIQSGICSLQRSTRTIFLSLPRILAHSRQRRLHSHHRNGCPQPLGPGKFRLLQPRCRRVESTGHKKNG